VIFQGTQDTVTNAEGCVLFHQQARSQDKAYRVPTSQAHFAHSLPARCTTGTSDLFTYQELEGWAHSLFDESARHELYKEMLEWVGQRTGKSKS
jgi:alpha-beta hydrolase superfamily lysophospholipase